MNRRDFLAAAIASSAAVLLDNEESVRRVRERGRVYSFPREATIWARPGVGEYWPMFPFVFPQQVKVTRIIERQGVTLRRVELNFYVDAERGSDGADGLFPATPLRTIAEAHRRAVLLMDRRATRG